MGAEAGLFVLFRGMQRAGEWTWLVFPVAPHAGAPIVSKGKVQRRRELKLEGKVLACSLGRTSILHTLVMHRSCKP